MPVKNTAKKTTKATNETNVISEFEKDFQAPGPLI